MPQTLEHLARWRVPIVAERRCDFRKRTPADPPRRHAVVGLGRHRPKSAGGMVTIRAPKGTLTTLARSVTRPGSALGPRPFAAFIGTALLGGVILATVLGYF